MSYIQRHVVTIETNSDGDATGYVPASGVLTGKICSIRYVKDDYDSGVDFVITSEQTGETIWSQQNVNANATVAPRQATHSTAGVAATYDGVGSKAVNAPICLSEDRVKIVIDEGGDTKSGTFHVVLE